MSDEWKPPEDDAELAAWLENFAENIPQHADKLNIPPEQVAEIRKHRDVFCGAHEKEVTRRWQEAARFVGMFRPRSEWPAVYVDADERLITTPEPVRTRWLELLERWLEGIRQVQGRAVQPKLQGAPHQQGLRLEYDFPFETNRVSLYFRIAGRPGWQFLATYTRSPYYLETMPREEEGYEDRKEWQGQALEFVAVAQFDEGPIGFPSDIVSLRVPEKYQAE